MTIDPYRKGKTMASIIFEVNGSPGNRAARTLKGSLILREGDPVPWLCMVGEATAGGSKLDSRLDRKHERLTANGIAVEVEMDYTIAIFFDRLHFAQIKTGLQIADSGFQLVPGDPAQKRRDGNSQKDGEVDHHHQNFQKGETPGFAGEHNKFLLASKNLPLISSVNSGEEEPLFPNIVISNFT
jgi:hypothetical protein